MALTLTPHGARPREQNGRLLDALDEQLSDAIHIPDGTVSEALESGIYRVIATSDCLVRFGSAGIADAAAGEPWFAGAMEVRWCRAGQRIAVDAAIIP
jgi:hypothetical protein